MHKYQKILIVIAIIEWGLFIDEIIRGLHWIHILILPLGIAGMIMVGKGMSQDSYIKDYN